MELVRRFLSRRTNMSRSKIHCCCIIIQFSGSVVSDSLWPHGLHHPRVPCPSPSPRACSNACPSNLWSHPTISSSVIPFSSRLQSFPASGSFPMSQLFISVAKVLELQLQHQSFQWIFRTNFLQNWLVWSPCSPKDSQESFSIPHPLGAGLAPIRDTGLAWCPPSSYHSWEASVLRHSSFFMVQLSHLLMTTGKKS